MARGFPDYITNRIRGLKGRAFRNITPDIERTAEGQMPVQSHFNFYDLPGYFPARAEYQGQMVYHENPGWFEGMDRMFQSGMRFVREAGESFVQQFEEMQKEQAYQPDPMSQEMFDFVMQQAHAQAVEVESYRGMLEATEMLEDTMVENGFDPYPDERAAAAAEQGKANLEIAAAIHEAGGGGHGEFDNLFILPGEPMELHDPGIEVVEQVEGELVMDEGMVDERPATLEDIVMDHMHQQQRLDDPEMMDDPMKMFYPGM